MKTKKSNKKQKYRLNLTKAELVHLRDLFSVVLPPDLSETITNVTVSQYLADSESEERFSLEFKLWEKIANLCNCGKVPLGDEAPDYVIAPVKQTKLGVFKVSNDCVEESPIQKPTIFESKIR